MKNATILGLLCAGLLCVFLVFAWRRGERGPVTRAAPLFENVESGRETPAMSLAETETREVVEAPVVKASEEKPTTKSARPEKKPGALRGHVVDANGARLPVGRVRIFRDPDDAEPLAQAEVEGDEREYHFSLTAEKAYYVAVDPASVENFGVPPLSKGFAAAMRGPDGAILPSGYTRMRVLAGEGETIWLDLPVARLADVVGRLLGEQGEPLPGIVARVNGIETISSGTTQDDTTDEHGVFRHHHLFPGSYRLSFFSPKASDDFRPPRVLDFALVDGEGRDLGDIRVQRDSCTVIGRIVDQDGRPFPGLPISCYPSATDKDQVRAFGLNDAVGRTKTGPDGSFELTELPAILCKISLTPNYEPSKVVEGQPAIWEQPVEVHLSRQQLVTDIGVHVVQQSRPFRLEGRLLEGAPGSHRGLKATVSDIGEGLPEGVRRTPLRRTPVKLDWEAGTFECLVETPRHEIELRFQLKGHEDRVFRIEPQPWGVWTQDIAIPQDFKPGK